MIPSPDPGDDTFAHRGPVREEWLGQVIEPALKPHLAIIDAHHHLWDRPGETYDLGSFLADTATGHRIIATILVESRSHYLVDGPPELRSLGETAYGRAVADCVQREHPNGPRIAEAIIASVDLSLGDAVQEILPQHQVSSGGRLRGVRHVSVWDEDRRLNSPAYPAPRQLLLDPEFRRGFAALGRTGLVFEAWCFHPQLSEVVDLARSFPDTLIVLNHLGTPVRIGRHGQDPERAFADWRVGLEAVATCPNVVLKVGGLGMRTFGLELERRDKPAGSLELCELWGPWFRVAVEAFGPQRCMLESNFPVDKGAFSYAVLWNAFILLSDGFSAKEKADLFALTAARTYGLPDLLVLGQERHADNTDADRTDLHELQTGRG